MHEFVNEPSVDAIGPRYGFRSVPETCGLDGAESRCMSE
jgi:hypothetical protein